MRRPIPWILLLSILPLALAVGAFLAMRNQYQPYGTRLLNPRPIETNQFSLVDPKGQTRTLSDYSGKAVLIFFGYVNCPDVCPTTMLELKNVYKSLSPAEQQRVQVIMVSVDPNRDTKEILGKYVGFFDPSFVGLVGTPEQTADAAKKYGVYYQKSNIKSATEYSVDHTAAVFALDGKGSLRLVYGNGKTKDTERVVKDVRWLLRG